MTTIAAMTAPRRPHLPLLLHLILLISSTTANGPISYTLELLSSRSHYRHHHRHRRIVYVPTLPSTAVEVSSILCIDRILGILHIIRGGGSGDNGMGDERRGDETEGKEEEVERKEERKPSSNVRMISSLAQIRELIEDSTSSSSPDDDDCEENDNNGGALVVLDFTSNNCPPCDMIRPVYDELSMLNEFAGTTMRRGGGDRSGPRVVFCKVNVSDHPDVAKYYGVDGWPTFLFFRDGILIDTIVGGNAAKEGLYGLVSKYA